MVEQGYERKLSKQFSNLPRSSITALKQGINEKLVTVAGAILKVLKGSKGKISNLFLFFTERRGRMG